MFKIGDGIERLQLSGCAAFRNGFLSGFSWGWRDYETVGPRRLTVSAMAEWDEGGGEHDSPGLHWACKPFEELHRNFDFLDATHRAERGRVVEANEAKIGRQRMEGSPYPYEFGPAIFTQASATDGVGGVVGPGGVHILDAFHVPRNIRHRFPEEVQPRLRYRPGTSGFPASASSRRINCQPLMRSPFFAGKKRTPARVARIRLCTADRADGPCGRPRRIVRVGEAADPVGQLVWLPPASSHFPWRRPRGLRSRGRARGIAACAAQQRLVRQSGSARARHHARHLALSYRQA